MSLHTFTINEKKLGFTLDKAKTTPTISSITAGGALEKQLIEKCSSISEGCEIFSIGGENVKGLSYNDAVEKIRTYVERPVNIVITSPRKSVIRDSFVSTQNSPRKNVIRDSFVSTQKAFKMSQEEMNKASEIATKQALRDLAKAHKETLLEENEEDSSYSEDEDEDDYVSVKKYNELEKKHHFLRMELLNAQIDNDDQVKTIKKSLDPLKNLNDQLCYINYLKQRTKKMNKLDDIKNSSSHEMKKRLLKIQDEYNEYLEEAEKFLNLIELHEIRNCVAKTIDKEKIELELFKKSYKCKINMRDSYEIIQLWSIIGFLAAILFGIASYKE